MLANTNELFVGDADWFGSTTTKVSGGYAYFTAARKLGNNAEAALDIMPPQKGTPHSMQRDAWSLRS